MSTTFLQLCQKANRLARISPESTAAYPTSTTNQEGTLLEIVNWINDAYADIQSDEPDWTFMHLQGTFTITSGNRTKTVAQIQSTLTTYESILPFLSRNRWIPVALAATGVSDQTPCFYVPYEDWRGIYDYQTRPTGKPQRFTVLPGGTLEFDPTPDATYTVYVDYKRTIDVLSGDSDTLIFPDQYADAVVWGALMYYANTRDNPAEYAKWKLNHDAEMGRLYRECLPEMTICLNDLY